MSTAMTTKEKPKAIEPVAKPTALARGREFPFFLSRMRDEFDRMFERFFTGWPAPWKEKLAGWRWGMDVEDKENEIEILEEFEKMVEEMKRKAHGEGERKKAGVPGRQ